MDAPGPRAPRVWRATGMTGPRLYYAVCGLFGLVALAGAAVIYRAGDTPREVSAGLWLVVGVALVAVGAGLALVPASRVERRADGAYVFSSRLRSVTVAPGELVSIRCLVPDPSRLWPMRVTAIAGTILLAPRIEGVGELCRELAANNPTAGITDPEPFSHRFDAPSDERRPPA